MRVCSPIPGYASGDRLLTEFELSDSVPVQLMHTDKTGSVKAVSVRRVHLPPLWVGVVQCAVLEGLSDFILEPMDNFPAGVLPGRSFNKSGKLCKLFLMK